MFNRFLDILVRWRWFVIILTFAITGYLLFYLGKIRFDSSSDGSVPKGDPSQEYFEIIKDDFGNDQVAMLVILSDEELGIFEPATLEKIKRLTDSIAEFDGVDNVVSLTNSTFLSGVGGEELTNDLIIPEIPRTRDTARIVRDDVLSNTLFHKTLVSEDGRAAAINIFLANEPDSVLLANGIDDRINEIVEKESGPEKLYYAGLIHTRMEINKTMHKDLGKFIPMSFILILIILFVSFRNLKGVFVPALTILISLIWTFGLVGWLDVPINMTMTIIPPLLIAIACSLTIHIISTYMEQGSKLQDRCSVIKKTFSSLATPLITAGVTTAIGFGSLMISPIPNIKKVGLFSVIGILFAVFISFTFIPALLATIRLKQRKSTTRKKHDIMSSVIEGVIRINLKARFVILIVAALVLAVSVIGMLRIRVDTDFLSYFKKNSEIRKGAEIIGKNLAGVSTFYVIASSDSIDAMRRTDVLCGVDSLQKFMESMPNIDKATSFVNIVKLFHKAMNSDNPDSFIVTKSQDVLDEEILLTIDQEEPAVRAHYVVEDYTSMAMFARSQLVSTSDLATTVKKIEKFAEEIMPADVSIAATGTVVVFAKSISAIIQGQRDSLILAFALIFIIMSFLFRSFRVGLISMISNIVPIFIIFGIMGWFGISLNLGTSIVASISLGIAVDDTIHYMMNYKRELIKGYDRRTAMVNAARHIGKPVIFTSLALALGFLVICLSDFGMLSSVGILSGVTMITCLISDLFLTSALLLTFDFSKNLKIENAKE